MKRKKLLTAAICVSIVSALIITAAAVTRYKFTSSSGSVVSKIVNRVNLEVSDTEFVFKNIKDEGELTCTTKISIEKTEPDFYGQLNSITINGQSFGSVIYVAGKNNGNALLPENVPLTSGTPLEWELSFTVPYREGKTDYELSLDFDYTTGVKANVSQTYITKIPITIKTE